MSKYNSANLACKNFCRDSSFGLADCRNCTNNPYKKDKEYKPGDHCPNFTGKHKDAIVVNKKVLPLTKPRLPIKQHR